MSARAIRRRRPSGPRWDASCPDSSSFPTAVGDIPSSTAASSMLTSSPTPPILSALAAKAEQIALRVAHRHPAHAELAHLVVDRRPERESTRDIGLELVRVDV